ncbi:hypothetical protein [Metabacillus malikii]|uniref:Effector of murein hydrolase n=1 Tax=Metabacillus malikii TaxID=1504265 RepID=A0ABT9ZCZ9_9BACI|nr:hypothetical protein [Metabacillus malikii]MDQ0230143.1 putative effector of murein hydrolase [Metabacillus malikii]
MPNKHITKGLVFSILITVFVFFIAENPKPITTINLLFVSIVSFICIYFISKMTTKAFKKFENDTASN